MKNSLVSYPVKVLHPITRLIVGGAQENTLFTAQYLDPSRYSVQVLSGPQTGSEGSLFEESAERGLHVTILPELVREISPQKDFLALKKMTGMFRNQQYKIVHTHSSKAGILGRLAAHQAKTPIILHTVHGWSFHHHMQPALQAMYISLEKLVYQYSDALLFVSRKDIELGKSTGILSKNNYYLIRSAIPLDDFNPAMYTKSEARNSLGIPLNVPVLGNVGRFSAQKDPISWIRVAAKVHSEYPECRFLMVGDGPLRQEVEKAIQAFGISEYITLTGLRRDIPALLSAMDVFLLTSLWEGLPRVVPQALAMGIPVVSNQVDGIEEAVIDGKNGFLAKPGDIQALADQCVNLLRNPFRRQVFAEYGKVLARREFSLERMITQIDEIYQNLLVKKQIREI